jgi:hypothetical protein
MHSSVTVLPELSGTVTVMVAVPLLTASAVPFASTLTPVLLLE